MKKLTYIFILAIIVYGFISLLSNTDDKIIQKIKKPYPEQKETNKANLPIESIKKKIQPLKPLVQRKINFISKDITIDNFNKIFNYQNIDILLTTYITTEDKEMQSAILNRFHKEIKIPEVINIIIDLYNNTNDKKEKGRLSVLLSSIDTDEKLNIFSKKINYLDKNMVADFVSATLETNSENSTLKLLEAIDNVNNIDYHMNGIKLIYSDTDKDSVLDVIKNNIDTNGFQFSKNQEDFILYILEGSSEDTKLSFIENYGDSFINQGFISNLKVNISNNERR